MARTYSLNDLGVTADDLILLGASGYSFDETDNISEEKRDEILSRLYDLKHKDRENAQKETPSAERKTPEIPAATAEQLKDMNYRLKHGEHLSAQEVASAVAGGSIVSKDIRAEIKNAIVNFTNADNVSEEEAGAVSYLLDELDGKHIEKHKNGHSVEEYKKQFADSPEILEAAGKKLEDINNAPAAVVMYDKEDIDALLKQGEMLLENPDEALVHLSDNELREKLSDADREAFANHVENCSALIKDYAEGRVAVEPDALETMEKMVEIYGREYTRGTASANKFKNGVSYDITQDAANAQQRLAAERVALKKDDKGLSKEEVEAAIKKNKYIAEAAPLVDELIEKIANAKNDAERQGAINVFKFETARQYVANQQDEGLLDFVRKDLEEKLNNNGGNKERKAAAKYLLDENGKLKDGVVFSTASEKETPVEEKVETKTEDKVEDKGPSKEEVEAAKKKKPKDRTLHDWIVLKEDIEHNPKLSEGQKKYELKSLTDQARTHKMNKSPKELSSDELKDADAFMAAFGYDIDRKGRKATNPVAMRWKEGVDKRKKAEAANDEIVVEQPVEQKTEQEPEEKKNDGKEDDKGKGGVAPVVIPGRHITNDKGVTEWEEHKPAQEKNKEKKKKGLFGWLKNAGSKAWGWCKRNWKKIAIGGAILAASLFGAKSCNSNQGGDDKGKDKIEVVTPTPQQKEHQLPELVVTDSIDQAMLHQYAKRVGYTDQLGEEAAIQKALADRHAYVTNQSKEIKDKIFGAKNGMTPEAQMAVLATVRNNNPELTDRVDGILQGTNHNPATALKLSTEASEWKAVDGKILAVHPEKWTKETGSQSITVSHEKLNNAVQARLNDIRNGNGGI